MADGLFINIRFSSVSVSHFTQKCSDLHTEQQQLRECFPVKPIHKIVSDWAVPGSHEV